MFLLETAVANSDTHYVCPQVLSTLELDARLPASLEIDPDSCFTDVLSQSAVPGAAILVSERLARVLTQFAVQDHSETAVQVFWRGEVRPYAWWFMRDDALDALDMAASRFERVGVDGQLSELVFDDAKALAHAARAWVDDLSAELRPRSLAWRSDAPNLDLFCLLLTRRFWFASDRLALMLQQGRYTGIELRALKD